MNEPDTHDETPQATDRLELDEFIAQCDLETPPEQLDPPELLKARVDTSRLLGMFEGIAITVNRLDSDTPTPNKQVTLEDLTDEYLPRVRSRALALESELERQVDRDEICLKKGA
jgi:hypothetical protein